MSLQWTFIATVLYTEIFCVVLLLLPFISPARWQRVFRSRLMAAFRSHASLYFNVFVLVLVVLFVDAIRDVKRYSLPLDETDLKNNPAAETIIHMKLFRAQRNLYIAGFALFLFVTLPLTDSVREMYRYRNLHDSTEVKAHEHAKTTVDMKMFRSQRNFYITGFTMILFLVLRRLVTLISRQATLLAECEAATKQAKSATEAAKLFMEDKDNKANEDSKDLVEQLDKKKMEVMKLKEELATSAADTGAMKKQAEATNKEYDRLLDEHAKLQDSVKKMAGGQESKKDD